MTDIDGIRERFRDCYDEFDTDTMVDDIGLLLERVDALEDHVETVKAWWEETAISRNKIKQERDDLSDEVTRLRGLLDEVEVRFRELVSDGGPLHTAILQMRDVNDA